MDDDDDDANVDVDVDVDVDEGIELESTNACSKSIKQAIAARFNFLNSVA